MTNDELEAVRARAENDDGWHDVADDAFALLDEVERQRSNADNAREMANDMEARATRAEAHAERLASLMGEMFEEGPVTVGFAGNPIAIVDLERRARAALSAYNQRTET